MAGFNLIDWLFGRTASSRSIQSQNVRPSTRLSAQPVAPERDTILSDGYAPPYRADDLDDFGCETDAMRQAYLRLFREEPSLKSAVEGKAESIASLDVMVKPCDDTKPDDVRAAKFVEWTIKATAHGWDGLFLNVLKPAFLLGWSCQEIVLRHVDRDESAEWGGFVGLRHCRSLNTAKLRLQLDAYRNVLGVVNTVRGLASYPRRKVLLYTHNELFHNPFGSGDAATAYRDANVIDAAMRLWGFAIKVYGGPFLKGKYSAKDRRKQMEAALDAARQGGWITMPKEDEVEVINLASATSFTAFQDKIKKHEERVYTAVRGAYLPYMQGGASGGETRGSAETSKSAGSDPKEYLVGVSVCRAINRDVVPHLVTPNFPAGTGMPEVVLGGVNWGETKVQLDVAKALKELGHEVEEEYLSKVTGMPIKPKAVQGSGATLPGGGPGGGPGAGPGGPSAGDGGAGSGGPSGTSGTGGTPAVLPPGPPAGGEAGTPVEPTSNPAPTPARQTQRPAAQTSDPTPAPPQVPSPAPAQAPAPNDSAVPAELLAAMTRAAEAGDWPAVQRLVNLGRHPEELEVLLGVAAADNATFAEWSPHTLADGSSGWKSSGGLIRKTKPKGADDTPAGDDSSGKLETPKRDVIAEAKSAKAGREPAREAARGAWAKAVADPSNVRAERLPELANHLRSLTRDELRGINRELGNRLGGLKEDHVQRLLNAVGFVGPQQPSATPAELQSLTNYTLASTAINTPLREGSLPVGGEERQAVEHLDRMADAGRTTAPMTLFRGADSDETSAIAKQLGVPLDSPQAVGRSFTDAGFVSAGRDRDKINERFGPGAGDDSRSMVRIEVPAGVPAIDVASHGGGAWAKETEHVLGRGLTYTVTGRDADGTLVVKAAAAAGDRAVPATDGTTPTPAAPASGPAPTGAPVIPPGTPGWNIAGNTVHPTREAAESALAAMPVKSEVRDYGVMPGTKDGVWFVAHKVNFEKVAARDAVRKAEFDKPSTTNVGRELIDGRSFSHLVGADANKISTVRAAANVEPNGTPHPLLGQVAHQAGFSAPPKVVTGAEMDDLSKSGWKVGYRGVASDDQHELFRSGPYWAGRGLAGAGTYVAMPMADGGDAADQLAKSRAESFGPAVARFAVAPDARIGNQADIDRQRRADADALKKEFRDGKITKTEFDAASAAIADTGVYAAMKGYDGYHVGDDPATESAEAREAAKTQGADYFVVLNRGKVAVEARSAGVGLDRAADRTPQEGDRNAAGLVLQDGRWRREGEDDTPAEKSPATAVDNPAPAGNTTPVQPQPAGANQGGGGMLVVTGDTFKHKDAIKAAGGKWDGSQWVVPAGAELPSGLGTRSSSEKSPAHAAVSDVLDQFNDPRLEDAKTFVAGNVPARLWKELPADPKTAAKLLAQKVPQVKAAIAAGNIKGASMTDTLIMHALVLGDRPFESIPMTQALVAAKAKGGA